MREAIMSCRHLLLVATALVTGLSCNPLKPKDKASTSHELTGAYSGQIKTGAALKISANAVVAVKEVPKSLNDSADDKALAEFQAALYGKLRDNCSGGCHDVNATIPLASPGVDLAWITVQSKGYITADPEQSLIVKDIRAAHHGVDPALADEIAPLIKNVADDLAAEAQPTAASLR
jgi:hypothetical protein